AAGPTAWSRTSRRAAGPWRARSASASAALRRELHGDHVTVAHHVVAALEAQRAAGARPPVAAGLDERVPSDHLGAHEAPLDVGMDLARGMPRAQPLAQVPRLRGLALARGEERDQPQQPERAVDDAAEPRLADAELLAHHRRLLVVELGQLGLDP